MAVSLRPDKVGVLVAVIAAAAAASPFATFKANRIVAGAPRSLFEALPPTGAAILAAVLAVAVVVALLRTPGWLRLAAALAALGALAVAIGAVPAHLTPEGDRLARVGPSTGFWLSLVAFAVMAADASIRLRLGPLARIVAVLLVALGVALLLRTGAWDGLSVMKEYAGRSDAFWREAGRHVALALGSLAAAIVVGIPLGVLCHRVPAVRGAILGVLNVVQTIPSIAMFGMLIAPLAAVAAAFPFLAALGVGGIGAAPAFVALFAYALLPMVANTVVGLASVPAAAVDAARGMGMTARQRLVRVEFPLAFPVILTGIRIVLVQNLGLATIAGLIGGGGFGVFVFQGLGQTAIDLVLLGALPTVALAFSAAILLDAAVEASRGRLA
ncbi:MAG: ABC transporter permease [Bauldia sp.]|nr:ABC transporter permease [Bauldia sp.]